MSNKSNASVQSMLVRWAELEPARVEILTASTAPWSEDIGQFYIQVQPDHRRVLRVDQPFGFSTVATLCAVIEAAIVERKDWQLELKGDFEGWEIRIWVRSVTRPVSAPTKLEALLPAYVQALEAGEK